MEEAFPSKRCKQFCIWNNVLQSLSSTRTRENGFYAAALADTFESAVLVTIDMAAHYSVHKAS